MSSNVSWKCLPVKDFIAQCNWENISLKLPQLASSNVIKPKSPLESWQCLTTQDFFGLNNWSGQVIFDDDQEQHELIKEAFVFDVTVPLAQFWQCFNWSGISEVTSEIKEERIIKETEEIIAEVEEFTLNNLSQLF
ncbi:MAG: hypothetical protein AAGA16_05795 [Cyanobacteria bacterium P01_E01_bin.35]